MSVTKTGILLVAFGGPDSLDAVEPFMRSVMGREPSEEVLAAARRKYLTIGGTSPLPAAAERIAAALERELSGLPPAEPPEEKDSDLFAGFLGSPSTRAESGVVYPVAVGMLHWRPSIEQAVTSLAASGVKRVVWVSLSPFESSVTTGAYRAAVEAACDATGLETVGVLPYVTAPAFVSLLASRCAGAYEELFPRYTPVVAFTAHSLPCDDPGAETYESQLHELAARIAAELHFGDPDPQALAKMLEVGAYGGVAESAPWLLAYQSRGARGCEWLSPSLDEVLEATTASSFDAIAVCPIGFAVDHMETLYDLDVEAADKALSSGLEFARAQAPNDDAAFVGVLADAVRIRL